MDICDPLFTTFLTNTIIPITAMASIASAVIVALGYMLGTVLSNVRVVTWAKTEVLQVVMSVASVAFIFMLLSTFCAINMDEVKGIFGIVTTPADPCGSPSGGTSVYDAAKGYLTDASCFSHNSVKAVRYHLQSYTVLSNLNLFECALSTGAIGWGCLFGYSGTSMQPLGGYGTAMSAMNVFFNSSIVAYVSALNFLFILMYVYRGFVLFFLPFGIFIRSVPYLRTFGSLLISVALAFLVVYPLLLSIFSLMGDVIFAVPPGVPAVYDELVFSSASGFEGSLGASYVKNTYFGGGKEQLIGVIEYSAAAFIAGVFLPTVALLATIASIRYSSRIFGEEIDLSRIVQMV
jgi:hypothetical protein